MSREIVPHHTPGAPKPEVVRSRVQPPRRALQPFVRRFLTVESMGERSDAHLPEAGFLVSFQFRGSCRLDAAGPAPDVAVSGLWDSMRAHAHSSDHAVVIVALTPAGAAALLPHSLDEFANRTVDLTDALGRAPALAQLQDALPVAGGDRQRVEQIESYLLSRLDSSRLDRDVLAAVSLIERGPAELRVERLAREIGLSQSALERRFRRYVGTSPRRFASLVRLRRVVQLHSRGLDLTTTAHEAGFYDQSHLIKEFRRFTGLSPRAYFTRYGAG